MAIGHMHACDTMRLVIVRATLECKRRRHHHNHHHHPRHQRAAAAAAPVWTGTSYELSRDPATCLCDFS